MNMIKCTDAKASLWGNGRTAWWAWPGMEMYFLQEESHIQKSYLEYNGVRQITWNGLVRPEDVWSDITARMIDYDIICEPLDVQLAHFNLPQMDLP